MWADVGRCGEMWGDVGRCVTCSIGMRRARPPASWKPPGIERREKEPRRLTYGRSEKAARACSGGGGGGWGGRAETVNVSVVRGWASHLWQERESCHAEDDHRGSEVGDCLAQLRVEVALRPEGRDAL